MASVFVFGCFVLFYTFSLVLELEGAACRSLETVVHPCVKEEETGDTVYLDTSNTYSMKGSCLCYINVTSTMGIDISVESGPSQCDAILDFTTLNFTISCGAMPPPLSTTIRETVYISWMKDKARRSTDACVKIEKTDKTKAGNLSLYCEKGGEFVKTTGDSPIISHFTTSTSSPQQPVTSLQQAEAAKKRLFESNVVVGVLAGIVIALFLLGLIVHCDERRIKAREAKARELLEQRRLAKMQAIHRMRPPRRKEVVETRL